MANRNSGSSASSCWIDWLMIELSLDCLEPPCAAPAQERDGRLDGEAQAATGGGEDGAGALSAAGLAATAATVTLRRWCRSGLGSRTKDPGRSKHRRGIHCACERDRHSEVCEPGEDSPPDFV